MTISARICLYPLGFCLFSFCFVGCGKAKQASAEASSVAAAPAAKISSTEDVNNELKEGQIALGSSREATRAFFQSHTNYQVCKDMDSFTIAVVRNSKIDKHADDIYIVARYNLDATVGALDVGPPQFSVGDLTSFCK